MRKPLFQIQQSAQRAAEIVQDLLTMARRGVDVKQVVNLNTVIGEYLMSLEHLKIRESHPDVVFEADLDDNLLNMQGSAIHLTKTVMNLVRNAAESMPQGGRLVAKTRNLYIEGCNLNGQDGLAEGDYVVLTVQDSGTGISREDMDRIFEPLLHEKGHGAQRHRLRDVRCFGNRPGP